MSLAPDLRPANDVTVPSLPASLEAEQGLIGAALFDADAYHAAASLRPEAFSEPMHAHIWTVIGERIGAGQRVDPTLLLGHLSADQALAEAGGAGYLLQLIDKAPAVKLAGDYAEQISECAARRELIRLGGELKERACASGETSALQLLTETEEALALIAERGVTRSGFRGAGDVVSASIQRARSRSPEPDFPSGLAELDDMTGGFTAGEVTILAARPGMGKTVAVTNMARANASAGRGTLLFSLEMSADMIGLRLACDLAFDADAVSYGGHGENPTYDRARRNDLSPEAWERLDEASRLVACWPLLIDDRAGLTVAQIEACARRAYREWERRGIRRGPLLVDHLGIVRPEKARGGNKIQETGDVSRGLAEMAKRLGVPVVAACQVNRATEDRGDKRPTLADLRWSGAIEEDARLVMFLHRPAYYLRAPDDGVEVASRRGEREAELHAVRNKLFFHVAKQNSGRTGSVEVFVDIGCSAIRDRRGLCR